MHNPNNAERGQSSAKPRRQSIVFFVTALLIHTLAGASQPLFSAHGDVVENPQPNILRAVPVTVNFDVLESAAVGDELEAEFFPDEIIHINVEDIERRAAGDATVTGHSADDTSCLLVLSYYDGAVSASLRNASSVLFEIFYEAGTSTHAVREINAKHVANVDCGVESEESNPEPSQGALGLEGCEPEGRSSTTVDVMFLYTPQALLDLGSRSHLISRMHQRVKLLNKALADSQAIARVRLVHIAALLFNDANNGALLSLYSLRTSATSIPPNYTANNVIVGGSSEPLTIFQLRDWVGADLVCAWVGNGEGLGHQYDPSKSHCANAEDLAFSRVNAKGDEYHLSHEIGHNFGGKHSCFRYACPLPPDISAIPGAFGWNFSIVGSIGATYFRTIMAYPRQDGNADSESRIGRFSNPALLYETGVTGIAGAGSQIYCSPLVGSEYCNNATDYAGADMAGVITSTAPILSTYRNEAEKLRVTGSGGRALLDIYSTGNCVVYGSVVTQSDFSSTTLEDSDDFLVRGGDAEILCRIEDDGGTVFLKGLVMINQSSAELDNFATTASNDLLVKNKAGDIVAVCDHDGNLRLLGDYRAYNWY